jgi:hypothetical protein
MRLNDNDEVVSLALVDKSEEPEDDEDAVSESVEAPAQT